MENPKRKKPKENHLKKQLKELLEKEKQQKNNLRIQEKCTIPLDNMVYFWYHFICLSI